MEIPGKSDPTISDWVVYVDKTVSAKGGGVEHFKELAFLVLKEESYRYGKGDLKFVIDTYLKAKREMLENVRDR